MLNPNARCYLEEGALGRWPGYEGGVRHYKGINPNRFERSSAPSAMEDTVKRCLLSTRSSLDTESAMPDSALLSLQNCEKFLLLINRTNLRYSVGSATKRPKGTSVLS